MSFSHSKHHRLADRRNESNNGMHAPTGQVPLIAGTVQVLGRLVHERVEILLCIQ